MSKNIIIENARIGFRNFSGKEGRYNPEGSRNFCVFLETDLANMLEEDGWNIRWLEPKEEYEDRQAYMQVAVNFKNIPPKIVMITGQGKTLLDEDMVGVLDWAEIENIDLTINPYNWEVGGKKGIKAYVKNMYVVITEDEFERKYYDVPDSAQNTMIPDYD